MNRGIDRSIENERSLACFRGDSISRSRSFSRAHDKKLSQSRDDIGQREREKKKRRRERARKEIISFFFSYALRCLASCHRTHTYAHPFARTSDRSRASFEKQCKRERHAGLSFLPTFLLTHVVPGSCSLPCPSLPIAFPVGPHRSLSFALFPSPPGVHHSRSPSFILFLIDSLFLP